LDTDSTLENGAENTIAFHASSFLLAHQNFEAEKPNQKKTPVTTMFCVISRLDGNWIKHNFIWNEEATKNEKFNEPNHKRRKHC
jgi:hypothetical protein